MQILQQTFEEKNVWIDVISFYNRKWKRYSMGFHAHGRLEVMYVRKGRCLVETTTASYRLKERDVILLNSNVPHRLEVEDFCHIMNFEFGLSRTGGILSTNDLKIENPDLSITADPEVAILHDTEDLDQLVAGELFELFSHDRRSEIVQLYFKLILLKIVRLDAIARSTSVHRTYIDDIIRYIHTNYGSAFTIEDLARHMCLSKVYLHKIFKKATNVTIIQYTTNIRIEKAKELLESTSMPITDICVHVGMNSRQYFSMVFKKETGSSPAEYRTNANNHYAFDSRVKEEEYFLPTDPVRCMG